MYDIGMYVLCPIKIYRQSQYRTLYVAGKITYIDEDTGLLDVVFYDHQKLNEKCCILDSLKKRYATYEVSRLSIAQDAQAIYKGKKVRVLRKSTSLKGKKDQFVYYCSLIGSGSKSVYPILENDLQVDFFDFQLSIIRKLKDLETSSVECYKTRSVLSERKHYLEKLPEIINTLVDTRVFLYAHQIDTVIRAVSNDKCRVMLADEVGLGKTIEAITVLKHYLRQKSSFKCLVIVPATLEYQWFNELKEKFNINAEAFSTYRYFQRKMSSNVYVISYGEYIRHRIDLLEQRWDMVIIDETHKILTTEMYKPLLNLCKKVENVILLSATPIQKHTNEYLNLLKMLNPKKYLGMDINDFEKLVANQAILKEKIYDMATDLDLFDDMDMSDIFCMNLREINELLEDVFLDKIISKIEENESDNTLLVKTAVEYIKNQYVVETPFIRHRRIDIQEANIKRRLESVYSYEMQGKDVGSAEIEVYSDVLDEIEEMISSAYEDNNMDVYMRLIAALHSSPYALISVLRENSCLNTSYRKFKEDIEVWKAFCDKEIAALSSGRSSNDTRFGCLLQAINECKEGKIIVFSVFKETVEQINYMLEKCFGVESVTCFTRTMTRLDTQLAARKFQTSDKCRFIVCDESGGEGRNFQCADYIVHFDMPWSPALMEQRIGRLDRIGREVDRDVKSIVIYSEESIEKKLFLLYNDSLNVFEKSLCGLEIVFEKMLSMIQNALSRDIKYGLTHVTSEIESMVAEMQDDVEREIYFSTTQNINIEQKQFIDSIEHCFEKEKDIHMAEEYTEWLKLSGVKVEGKTSGIVSIKDECCNDIDRCVSMYVHPAADLEIVGTFSREMALNNEDVEFFSPSSTLCKAIFQNLHVNQAGRVLALRCGVGQGRWSGFLTTWNVTYNFEKIYRIQKELFTNFNVKEFLPSEQIRVIAKFNGTDELNENELYFQIRRPAESLIEIEQISDFNGFGELFSEDTWYAFCKQKISEAKKEATLTARKWVKKKMLEETLQKETIVSNIMGLNSSDTSNIDLIRWGFEHLEVHLDSVVYIEL